MSTELNKNLQNFYQDVIIPMAKKAGLDASEYHSCIKYDGNMFYSVLPFIDFIKTKPIIDQYDLNKFEFCIFILDKTPIFLDDVVYFTETAFKNLYVDFHPFFDFSCKIQSREKIYSDDSGKWSYSNIIPFYTSDNFYFTELTIGKVLDLYKSGDLLLEPSEKNTFDLHIQDFPKAGGYDQGTSSTIEITGHGIGGVPRILLLNYSSSEVAKDVFYKLHDILTLEENQLCKPKN